MANEVGRGGDLVLAPGEFAFVLDTTKGIIGTVVGPHKTSMSNTDQPVLWNRTARKFVFCDPEAAKQIESIAPEGFYIALYNPAKDDEHPRSGTASNQIPLQVGHRVNIPGPVNFPLWPGQFANVIQGHHLRSNQYLLVQVYNDAEATANWSKAVVKTTEGTDELAKPKAFTPGQLIVIKGTEVSFFIPPTGVKVMPETPKGKDFVREAVTLERLEYCILLDEDGNKRFIQGPDVVFPEPTETFIKKDADRKFRAIELNETTGIYVKIIKDYTEGGVNYKTGDELFITGKEQAIYFQREEHSVIRYDDQTKHYAVAVPAGEGRYVLNRKTGVVNLRKGPMMLLCDPREEVIIRRVLAQNTAQLWYPGNTRVLEVNKQLADLLKPEDPSQYVRTASFSASVANYEGERMTSKQLAGDTFTRKGSFTPPRTITLDTKYEGAVSLSVWTGYAVMVIDKSGGRKVVEGPENILLEYDETLAQLELSRGRPKSDENLFRTVYLRVKNNVVSDVIDVETKDLVKMKISLSYRVNFEGDNSNRWFEVENYVRLLCDHMRSMIRNVAKRTNVEEFYSNTIDIIRNTTLGESTNGAQRLGRLFAENNMRIYDVEVLNVQISDPTVSNLLLNAQQDAITTTIEIAKKNRELDKTRQLETIAQEIAAAKSATVLRTHALGKEEILAKLELELERVSSEAKTAQAKLDNEMERQTVLNELNEAELARDKANAEQQLEFKTHEVELELKRIIGETEEITKRAGAVSPALATALTTFSDQNLIEKISTALAPMAAMNGVSVADVLAKVFGGTPFEGVMKTLGTRSRMPIETSVK